jgi:hypothetical protein
MSVGAYLGKLFIFVGYNVNGIEPFLITQIIKLPIFLKVFETGGFINLENFPSNPHQMMKPCQTFIKIKHPRKGEKRKTRTKVQASKQPIIGRSQGGKGTSKYQNLHQSLEAY